MFILAFVEMERTFILLKKKEIFLGACRPQVVQKLSVRCFGQINGEQIGGLCFRADEIHSRDRHLCEKSVYKRSVLILVEIYRTNPDKETISYKEWPGKMQSPLPLFRALLG
jgi:hypothetical protein